MREDLTNKMNRMESERTQLIQQYDNKENEREMQTIVEEAVQWEEARDRDELLLELELLEAEENNTEDDESSGEEDIVEVHGASQEDGIERSEEGVVEGGGDSEAELRRLNAVLKQRVDDLEMHLSSVKFSVQLLKRNEKHCGIYTGLPSWKVFDHVFKFVAPHASHAVALSLEDELLLTLSHLRLGLNVEDLSVRFAISSTQDF